MKVILPLAIVVIAVSPQLGATDMRFSDQTQAAGLSLIHKSTINPRSGPMPAGGAVGDFNGDGYPDL
ncbi:unnamed protein product, partial [Hapterophycus canaliculatus]